MITLLQNQHLAVRRWLFSFSRLQTQRMSRSSEAYATAVVEKFHPYASPLTFEAIGLRSPIIDALRATFPNVRHPTEMQVKFIPAILNGHDVLLKDDTGSGKSFGLVLALLSKPRRHITDAGGKGQQFITSLVIVPHRDLAYQLLHWIDQMINSPVVRSPPPLSSVAQVVVRYGDSHLTTSLSHIRQNPPHILIGTPQALMDIWTKDHAALQLPNLSTVVVDEVDYLIETAPLKDPDKTYYKALLKTKKKIERHPSPTRQLLDIIYTTRKQVYDGDYGTESSGADQASAQLGPQLIMSSATLRKHLDRFLFQESGWLQKGNLAKFKRQATMSSEDHITNKVAGGTELLHSVLVVSSNGDVKNIAEALPVTTEPSHPSDPEIITPESIFTSSPAVESLSTIEPEAIEKYANTPSPFNPTALEAIAIAFALDVPSVGLLVIPSSAPVIRAVHELRELGVNAHALDMLVADNGRAHLLQGGETVQADPTLLVSTVATTRGLDLPHLTHVFILGVPGGPKVTGRTIDTYLHIAGRVGRFGRGGKVITVVEYSSEVTPNASSKMLRIFRDINVVPVRFEHFD